MGNIYFLLLEVFRFSDLFFLKSIYLWRENTGANTYHELGCLVLKWGGGRFLIDRYKLQAFTATMFLSDVFERSAECSLGYIRKPLKLVSVYVRFMKV